MIDKSKKFSSYTKLKILNLLKELEKEWASVIFIAVNVEKNFHGFIGKI
jgi:hypothetical protein